MMILAVTAALLALGETAGDTAGGTSGGGSGGLARDTLTITRLRYDGGGDWYGNPSSLPNLLAAIRDRANLPVSTREQTVGLLDPGLADHPYLYMTGHGNVAWTPGERQALRAFLLAGGFLHADDN